MDKCKINIAVIEPSTVLYEGLCNVLLKSHHHYYFYRFSDLDELALMCEKADFKIAVVNPVMVQNKQNAFVRFKKKLSSVYWMGLVYSYFDNELLALFDDQFSITDPLDLLLSRFEKACKRCSCAMIENNVLTEREIEVLVALTKGLSNKEIADIMNISVHTVITHRKNLIQKTGLHSLPALTMYAIAKRLISFDPGD